MWYIYIFKGKSVFVDKQCWFLHSSREVRPVLMTPSDYLLRLSLINIKHIVEFEHKAYCRIC